MIKVQAKFGKLADKGDRDAVIFGRALKNINGEIRSRGFRCTNNGSEFVSIKKKQEHQTIKERIKDDARLPGLAINIDPFCYYDARNQSSSLKFGVLINIKSDVYYPDEIKNLSPDLIKDYKSFEKKYFEISCFETECNGFYVKLEQKDCNNDTKKCKLSGLLIDGILSPRSFNVGTIKGIKIINKKDRRFFLDWGVNSFLVNFNTGIVEFSQSGPTTEGRGIGRCQEDFKYSYHEKQDL